MHLNPTQVHQNIHVELVMNLSLGSIKLYAAGVIWSFISMVVIKAWIQYVITFDHRI
jgi:hypothetical protein